MFKKNLLLASSVMLLIACIVFGISIGQLISLWGLPYVLLSVLSIGIGYLFKQHFFGKVLLAISLFIYIVLTSEHLYFFIALVALVICGSLLTKSMMAQTMRRMQNLTIDNMPTQYHAQVTKDTWLDPSVSLDGSFSFEDIHDTSLIGDTVINLTQTILPDTNSVIVLHKGFGDIRILVPLDVGVLLSCHTLYGNVLFEKEDYTLKNAKLTMYSNNYVTSSKKIKIVTTVYIGNVEVMYV
ncbi:cell wall-active antibiotics response protein [Carnobacteriaceae bacterium zg-ZUI252]|nr:cell wall-active antibiotics response protein [Carnobacteriaceae bacterium zg-ZUI252]